MRRRPLPLFTILSVILAPSLARPLRAAAPAPPLNGEYRGTCHKPRDVEKPLTLTISEQQQGRFQCRIVTPQQGAFKGSGEISPQRKMTLQAGSPGGTMVRLEGELDPDGQKLSGTYEVRQGGTVQGKGVFSVARLKRP